MTADTALPAGPMRREAAAIARLQGSYYLVTGAWPMAWMASFELVTGPKRERWLVRTVALLLCVIGASLVGAERHASVTPETRLVGIGTAASLAAIDLFYTLRGTLRPVYLLDALFELLFIRGWWRAARAAVDRTTEG